MVWHIRKSLLLIGKGYAVARTQAELDVLVRQYPDIITSWVMNVTSEEF
jgi:hypothetical protein